jgi:hypothetical protein
MVTLWSMYFLIYVVWQCNLASIPGYAPYIQIVVRYPDMARFC